MFDSDDIEPRRKMAKIVGCEQEEDAPLSCRSRLVQNNHSGGIR